MGQPDTDCGQRDPGDLSRNQVNEVGSSAQKRPLMAIAMTKIYVCDMYPSLKSHAQILLDTK